MVEEWLAARGDQTAVMLASRLDDVVQLNEQARARLAESGVIGGDEVVLGGRGFAAGDLVLALRKHRRLDVLNGTRAVIERIDIEHEAIHCRTDDHRPLRLPLDYASSRHITHAYAMTIHKAQGATYNRCFVLAGDQLTKESAYTALSRARHGTDLYVVSEYARADDAHVSELRTGPNELLRSAFPPVPSSWRSSPSRREGMRRRQMKISALMWVCERRLCGADGFRCRRGTSTR